jgi:hypothetical protein
MYDEIRTRLREASKTSEITPTNQSWSVYAGSLIISLLTEDVGR